MTDNLSNHSFKNRSIFIRYLIKLFFLYSSQRRKRRFASFSMFFNNFNLRFTSSYESRLPLMACVFWRARSFAGHVAVISKVNVKTQLSHRNAAPSLRGSKRETGFKISHPWSLLEVSSKSTRVSLSLSLSTVSLYQSPPSSPPHKNKWEKKSGSATPDWPPSSP